jgi:hypothetical protein
MGYGRLPLSLLLLSRAGLIGSRLGFPMASGVFQQYYTTHDFAASDLSSVAAIGTTSTVC